MSYHVLIELYRGSNDKESISEFFETEAEARELISNVEWVCEFDTIFELFKTLEDKEVFKTNLPNVYEDFIKFLEEHEIEYNPVYFFDVFTNEVQNSYDGDLLFEVDSVLLTKSEIILSY